MRSRQSPDCVQSGARLRQRTEIELEAEATDWRCCRRRMVRVRSAVQSDLRYAAIDRRSVAGRMRLMYDCEGPPYGPLGGRSGDRMECGGGHRCRVKHAHPFSSRTCAASLALYYASRLSICRLLLTHALQSTHTNMDAEDLAGGGEGSSGSGAAAIEAAATAGPSYLKNTFFDTEPDEDFDLTGADNQVWLVKVPKFLQNGWNSVDEPGLHLGTVRVYECVQCAAA